MPKQLSIRISDRHWKALQERAAKEGVGVHVLIRRLFEREFPSDVTTSPDDVATSDGSWIPAEEKVHPLGD